MTPDVWESGEGDGVQFDIYVNNGSAQDHIYSKYIDPKNVIDDRRWFDEEINLSKWAGQQVTFTFETSPGPNGDSRYDWAIWGEPRIVQPIASDLVAQFAEANISTQQMGKIDIQTQTINSDTRNIIFQHPVSRLIYSLDLPDQTILSFGLGMSPEVWSPEKGDGVQYTIYVKRNRPT